MLKEVNNDELRVCSSSNPFRSTSANPFAVDSNKLGKSILKPSLLSFNSSTTSNNSLLKQSTFNPFNKSTEDNLTNNSDKKQSNGDVVKFVPLVKSDPQKPVDHPTLSNEVTSSSTTPTPSFVFGQNLQERVSSFCSIVIVVFTKIVGVKYLFLTLCRTSRENVTSHISLSLDYLTVSLKNRWR